MNRKFKSSNKKITLPASINLKIFISILQREILQKSFKRDEEKDDMQDFIKDLISKLNTNDSEMVLKDKTNGYMSMKKRELEKRNDWNLNKTAIEITVSEVLEKKNLLMKNLQYLKFKLSINEFF